MVGCFSRQSETENGCKCEKVEQKKIDEKQGFEGEISHNFRDKKIKWFGNRLGCPGEVRKILE